MIGAVLVSATQVAIAGYLLWLGVESLLGRSLRPPRWKDPIVLVMYHNRWIIEMALGMLVLAVPVALIILSVGLIAVVLILPWREGETLQAEGCGCGGVDVDIFGWLGPSGKFALQNLVLAALSLATYGLVAMYGYSSSIIVATPIAFGLLTFGYILARGRGVVRRQFVQDRV